MNMSIVQRGDVTLIMFATKSLFCAVSASAVPAVANLIHLFFG